jgi:peptide subunit release factor 1 (eRF1)
MSKGKPIGVLKAKLEKEYEDFELLKFKRFIENIKKQEGFGTSLLSIFVPNTGALYQMRKKLNIEMGTSDNIKDPRNRQSV